jgi:UDP-2,3-diacylglucosamine hydrolase
MRVWIFSDLHLTNSSSALYQAFLKTLEEPKFSDDVVVFSGDLFDLLVGDSTYFRRKFAGFFVAVENLAKLGVQLHYIEGNHDFHLRKLFQTAIRFHEEAVVLEDHSGSKPKRIYIAHGDLVDQEDHSYLKLRKFLRGNPIRVLSHWIPGSFVQSIGDFLSRSLAEKAHDLPDAWPAEKRERLREVFRKFAAEKHRAGNDFVVLGHCHDLDAVPPYYFNMGYPPVHQQYLFYGPTPDHAEASLRRIVFPAS